MIECSNCGKKIDFLFDYQATWMSNEDYNEHVFYVCSECIKRLPHTEPRIGCDMCGINDGKIYQITFRKINTGELCYAGVFCKQCFIDLYNNLHEEYLNKFLKK